MAKKYVIKDGVFVPAWTREFPKGLRFCAQWILDGLGIGLGLCIALPIAEAVRVLFGG